MEVCELTKEPYEVSEDDVPHELDKSPDIRVAIILPIVVTIIVSMFVVNIFHITSHTESAIVVPIVVPTQGPCLEPLTNVSNWSSSYYNYSTWYNNSIWNNNGTIWYDNNTTYVYYSINQNTSTFFINSSYY